ncbi:MAG: hypothetical protein DMD76_09975 [Candidatus Rokuibacteriota bacterium]|nr:MAG: hypothetical protein DMD76_09975 [Candidatus Rokubacteria bacterium]
MKGGISAPRPRRRCRARRAPRRCAPVSSAARRARWCRRFPARRHSRAAPAWARRARAGARRDHGGRRPS